MSSFRFIAVLMVCLFHGVHLANAQEKPVVLVAATIIDGSGKVLHNQTIVVEGSRIKQVGGQIPAERWSTTSGVLPSLQG